MPPIITNLTQTTELEAINTMLSAIGESPLPASTDLTTVTQADVAMAINILRDNCREVQSLGWKFNMEFGYELAPAAQYTWVDTAGISTPLNIFVPPAALVAYFVTKIAEQQQMKLVDTMIRPSRKYVPGTLVFYDRTNARDGFPVKDRGFLYINPIWLFDFDILPESARRYIVTKATRIFQASAVGSDTLARFTERDEQIALRTLKREQGQEDSYSFLQNVSLFFDRGGRPSMPQGTSDPRTNRNSV